MLLLFLSACERTELLPNNESLNQPTGIENVEVINGELHFTNPETYFEDVQKILDMNEIELDEWEASIGFRSLRSVVNEANEEFGNLASADEIPTWQEKYKDVVTFRKDEVEPLVSLGYYQTIANRSGEYMIGETYAKVLPEKTIMIRNGDRSRLQEALQLEKSDFDKGILLLYYGKNYTIQTRSGCSDTQRDFSENGKRRAYLEMDVYEESSGGLSHTRFEVHVFGKKKAFGWHKYKTQHQAQYINFEVYDNNNNLVSLTSDDAFLVLYDVKDFRVYYNFNDLTLSNYYTIDPTFERVKGRSTTRGTDRQWANICCNYYQSYCPETVGDSYFTS